jgi:ubiquinone/menaquinone biosynthesis C-methylase UbiE
MQPDFGRTAQDYADHRAGFPESLFERLAARGVGVAGQRVVDLGTGTGTLARGFAQRGCEVTGIDPAEAMLEQARALDERAGVRSAYRVGRAEQTGLDARCADVVSAGQCWHWFDRPAAAREISRILRPGGFLVIAHFDWIALPGNVLEATEALIEAHNPEWKFAGGLGLYPAWLRDLGKAGYREIESFSYDVETPYTPESWRGRVRASAGVAASLSPERIAAFDRDLAALLEQRFPGESIGVPHRVFAVIARSPAREDS